MMNTQYNEESGEIRRDDSKRRIGALDVAVIISVIALIVFAVLRLGLADRVFFSGQNFNVVIESGAISAETVSSVSTGDSVVFSDGKPLGTVVSVESAPAVFEATADNGERILVAYPEGGPVRITLTVSVRLAWKDGRYVTSSGSRVTPGDKTVFSTKFASIEGTVISIKEAG